MSSSSRYSRPTISFYQTVFLVTCVVNLTERAASETAIATEIKIKCSHVDELYYTSPVSNCRSFYRCTHRGVREVKVCGGGAVFDFRKQSCTTRVTAVLASATCQDLNCADQHNGVYRDIAHGCHRSYTCHAGQLTSIDNCPAKKLHNGTACVRQELVQCPTTIALSPAPIIDRQGIVSTYSTKVTSTQCEGKKDGDHPDESSVDCTFYISCKNGQFVGRHRCNNLAVFDGSSCVPSILHICSKSSTSSTSLQSTTANSRTMMMTTHLFELMNDCHGRDDGIYGSPHGCSYYMRCSGGRPLEIKECNAGYYFSMEARGCIADVGDPSTRECYDMGLSLDCDAKSTGFYTDENCESYYYCNRGSKTLYRCGSGKLYNGSTCVPNTEHNCRQRNNDGDTFCAERPDGYYQDTKDGCRTYHFCSNGYKITYLCEMGRVYDVSLKKCVHPSSISNPENGKECSNFHCYGKSDGYHADLHSNCRDYMFCRNQEKISHFTCRNGNVFNGQKCVPADIWSCPSLYNHRQVNCMPSHCGHKCQTDGFYADIKSECRNYFSCIGGTISRLSCPSGMRFNGELCVAEDKLLCPVFCESETSSSCPLGGFVNI